MKKLSKYLAAAFLVSLLTLSVAACPSGGDSKTTHTHDWGEWETVTEATCTEDGTKTRVCLHDSSHFENDIIPINAKAHEWGEWQTITEPTCTGSGTKTRVCLHDGSHIENGTIPALGLEHEFANWIIITEPTETEDGEQAQVCSHCGETKIFPITAGLTYSFNGGMQEVKAGKANGDVYIPAYHDGRPVTSINHNGFYGRKNLTSVFIPDSVVFIGVEAFSECTNLTSIVIPNSVTSIGYAAFYKCTSLTSVVISNSVKAIDIYTFFGCSNLTNVVIPDSVVFIAPNAFNGCVSLTTIFYGGADNTEWDLISIGDENEPLTKTRYYYSETRPVTSGRYWRWVNDKPAVWI